ncbi:MAG: phytanoyl-CoA dioxygenase family protein [Bacteroidota bacterium]
MQSVSNPDSGPHRRQANRYLITAAEIAAYQRDGFLILHDVFTEEDLADLDFWFDHFISGKEPNMGRDFCDMSQNYDTPFSQWQLVNAMLPSHYRSELANNVFHRISQSIADQLYQDGEAALDYEQFLAKRPRQEKAEFAMHQDLGYWPKTKNTWTATFSLALSDSDLENGCLQVVPGSNQEPELRAHRPKGASSDATDVKRDDNHTLVIETRTTDEVVYLPVKRGDLTIHDEKIVHGSGGNTSDRWRKTYVAAYRDVTTIAQERAIGFTHSHNDKVNWDAIIE